MVSATLDMERVGSEAEKELAAFLSAVEQVFGSSEIHRAANFWLAALEQTGPFHDRPEEIFRDVTIQATTRLTDIAEPRVLIGDDKLN
jgi:hypothetical protein